MQPGRHTAIFLLWWVQKRSLADVIGAAHMGLCTRPSQGCHLAKRTPHQVRWQPLTVAPYADVMVGAAVLLPVHPLRGLLPSAIAKPATLPLPQLV